MKKIITFFSFLFLIVLGDQVSAQTYIPVDKSSTIKIIIKNAGLATEGKLSGLEGDIKFNPADLKSALFSVSINAATINTDIDVRDSSLRGPEYLDTRKFPRISFISKQVIAVAGKANTYTMKGTLTLKGINKEISFPFTAVPQNDGLFFSGEFRINRLDYKIGVGSLVLSDYLTISLSVFARKE